MVFTNSYSSSTLPEVIALRKKTRMRFVAMALPWLVVAAVVIDRIGLHSVTFNGPFGTGLLILSMAAFFYLALDMSTFLPFLGETILPPSVIATKTPVDAAISVDVRVPVGATHVIYWASDPGSPGTSANATPWDSYGNYTNSGVVAAETGGTATLLVQCPQQYKVFGRTLPRHVHYRAVYKTGILGPVQTTPITCA